MNFYPQFNYYIIVSTEDHIELVKGGIGTYLGLLFQYLKERLGNVRLIWITESPSSNFFVRKDGIHHIFYIPKNINGITNTIERTCTRIHKLLILNRKNKIVIEAPDWEGLLSNLFSKDLGANTLKITRLHSVLALTKQNISEFTDKEKAQMQREYKQLKYSDLISAPTKYVYEFTNTLLKQSLTQIPHCIIPNFINTKFCNTKYITRETACNNFNSILKNNIICSNNKNVFCIGSLEYRKGIDLIIKISEIILNQDENIHFYLIGHFAKDGDSLTLNTKYSIQDLKSIIPDNISSNLHICGYIPYAQLKNLYNASDTFLFCYRHDNFPGALIEACLSGKNVVYFKRGGCTEIMKNGNEDLGIGFDGDNEYEIVQNGAIALQKSLDNLDKYSAVSIQNKYITNDIILKMCDEYKIRR